MIASQTLKMLHMLILGLSDATTVYISANGVAQSLVTNSP